MNDIINTWMFDIGLQPQAGFQIFKNLYHSHLKRVAWYYEIITNALVSLSLFFVNN